MNYIETHQNISASERAGQIAEAIIRFFERDINPKGFRSSYL
jgi:hypothetical protein